MTDETAWPWGLGTIVDGGGSSDEVSGATLCDGGRPRASGIGLAAMQRVRSACALKAMSTVGGQKVATSCARMADGLGR